jgi:hypothetical protein
LSIVTKTTDERVRLQALTLIDQCNSHRMEMVTNRDVFSNALRYVNGKAERLVRELELLPKQSEEVEQEKAEWEEKWEEEEDYQTTVTTETE